MRYGDFVSVSGKIIDEITAVHMPKGKSYTGLDQAEIFCHGGLQVVRLILDELIGAGARPAEPGEFTKLAFLNGRIDLTKAEAVAEIIAANTRASYQASREHLLGAYSEHVGELRQRLIAVLAEIEASIDFAEEEIDPAGVNQLAASLEQVSDHIGELLASYTGGRIVNEGFRIAISGRPNAGKSSLFNQLLRHERALVNPAAGTTRDYLSEWIDLDGFAVNLIDTAGLRRAGSGLEKLGQDRTEKIIREVNLLLWMFDFSKKDWKRKLKADLETLGKRHIILIANKIDLMDITVRRSAAAEFSALPVSCLTGAGIRRLRKTILEHIKEYMPDLTSGLVVTSVRHKQKLTQALKATRSVRELLERGESPELIAFDLRRAVDALDEITGRVYNEDVLRRIFSRFCVGK